MAKSRRSRRASRRRSRSRRVRRGGGIAGTLYSPISHLLQATNEAVGTVTNTVKSGVNRIGKSVTGHADAAVRNVFSRKGRKASRKSRKGRKSRRAGRR